MKVILHNVSALHITLKLRAYETLFGCKALMRVSGTFYDHENRLYVVDDVMLSEIDLNDGDLCIYCDDRWIKATCGCGQLFDITFDTEDV